MTDDDLLGALRVRRADAATRVDSHSTSPPPLFGPAASIAVREAEAQLGFRLPSLLSRVYQEVGDGGFGPGFGLLGVAGGFVDAEGRSMPDRYLHLLPQGWPTQLLPLFDWGCGAWSCVDAVGDGAHVVTMDESGPTVTQFDLRSWLAAWAGGTSLIGEIYDLGSATMVTMMNPFTRRPMPIASRGRARGRRGLGR